MEVGSRDTSAILRRLHFVVIFSGPLLHKRCRAASREYLPAAGSSVQGMATLLLSAVHEDVAAFLLARLRALVEAADRCLISALGQARPVAPLHLMRVDLMIENGRLFN